MNCLTDLPTFAIIIGVSNYQSDAFDPLPGAKSDAFNLSRSLIEWGIPKKNIFLLNDPFITGDKFEDCLKQLEAISEPFQLLFYFCGHGHRTTGSTPESFLIFSDHQVQLDSLLLSLSKINTSSLYIFIDACHLRFNSIINPKLIEEIRGKKESSKSFFCLLSSGIFSSFENTNHEYGFFTQSLIKGLGTIRQLDRSPNRLFSLIQKQLSDDDLPPPEMYNIGTHAIDFFPPRPKEVKEFKKALGAIYSCGTFINEELFCKVFDIEISTLNSLENLELTFFKNGVWHSHASLAEIVESEEIAVEQNLAKIYWSKQLDDRPGHFESALHFVLTMQCFGYEPNLEEHLKSAFQILARDTSSALEVLKKSPDLYQSCLDSLPPSAICLAEILIELQQLDLAKPLLGNPFCASKAHLLWRNGLFSKCIDETTRQIDTLIDRSSKIPYCFHRGTAHYFLGNWESAKADFSFIKRYSKDPRSIGRANCLIGTITGIRGIEVKSSIALVESGIQLLLKSGDFSGAWVGWNNLGEIMWKAGELKSSERYLQKALEISENHNTLLETLRNCLQLELRRTNCTKAKILSFLDQIEPLLKKPLEIFETMQLYNTLCTTYYYLQEIDLARDFLRKAIPLTTLSREYHIYTLSNLSLLDKSNVYFEEALALAKGGNNKFAIEQIKQDHLLVHRAS